MKTLLKAVLMMSLMTATLFADGQMGSGGYEGCSGEGCPPPCQVDCPPPPCTENCGRPAGQDDLDKEAAGQMYLGEGLYYDAVKFIIYRF